MSACVIRLNRGRSTLIRTALMLGLAAPLGAAVERAPVAELAPFGARPGHPPRSPAAMMGWSSPHAVPFHGAARGFPIPPGFPEQAPGRRLAALPSPGQPQTYS